MRHIAQLLTCCAKLQLAATARCLPLHVLGYLDGFVLHL